MGRSQQLMMWVRFGELAPLPHASKWGRGITPKFEGLTAIDIKMRPASGKKPPVGYCMNYDKRQVYVASATTYRDIAEYPDCSLGQEKPFEYVQVLK